MLPKEWRLVRELEIKNSFQTKYRFATQHTQLYLKASDKSNFQLLILVSKKIFKKANKRNRIRRKIVSIFENLKHNNRLPNKIFCTVQVKNKNILKLTNIEIKDEIIPQISKLYQRLSTQQK